MAGTSPSTTPTEPSLAAVKRAYRHVPEDFYELPPDQQMKICEQIGAGIVEEVTGQRPDLPA